VYSASFTQRRAYFTVSINYPHVWFEDPRYPGVAVVLYDYKTRAVVNISAGNLGARVVSRTGLVYDLTQGRDYVLQYFEEYGSGCTFYYTSDGSGVKVTGNPSGGLYGGCTLRYKYPPRVLANVSFTALMKTNNPGTPVDGIRGVSLWNSTTGYYYLAGIKNNATGWFFGIYKYTGRAIREPGGPVLPALRDTRITGRVTGIWFSISITQTLYPNGTLIVRAWLYNVTGGGRLVAYVEAVDRSPIYTDNFGLTVYQIRNKPSAVFQIIGFTTQIYVIVVRGLSYCCYVYIYDSAGNLLGSGHVNEAGVAEIMLTNPSVSNATISVSCNGYTYNYTQRVLLGGDVYELYYWFEGPVLAVYTDILNTSFTGWLRVHSVSCSGSIYYIGVWLVNQTSTSTRVNITQVDGYLLVHPEETSLLVFTPGSTGWAGNVTLRAELYYRAHCTLQVSFYFNYTSATVGELRATLYIKSG
jgi:hypothetical protein